MGKIGYESGEGAAAETKRRQETDQSKGHQTAAAGSIEVVLSSPEDTVGPGQKEG